MVEFLPPLGEALDPPPALFLPVGEAVDPPPPAAPLFDGFGPETVSSSSSSLQSVVQSSPPLGPVGFTGVLVSSQSSETVVVVDVAPDFEVGDLVAVAEEVAAVVDETVVVAEEEGLVEDQVTARWASQTAF